MNKTAKKERHWTIGCLLIFIGAFLTVLFFFSVGNFIFFDLLSYFSLDFFITRLVAQIFHFKLTTIYDLLSSYSLGFFILGLVTLFFGCLLSIIHVYNNEELDSLTDNRNKVKAILIIVIVFYLNSLGHLINVNTEWNIQALIIQIFDQSYAFYPGFIVSSYQIFFPTLLLFGILILPAFIIEIGFLDDSSSKQVNEKDKEIYQKKQSNMTFYRFLSFIRTLTDSIKKYQFPIGLTFTVFGSFLIILPYFLLIDIQKMDSRTHVEYYEPYYGFVRGQLLLIGLFFFIIGLIIILYYYRNRNLINQQ